MLPSGREIAAAVRRLPGHRGQSRHRPAGLGLVTPRPGAGTVVTAPRPPADRARGGPLLITLATRTPARPGDKARVLEAGIVAAPQNVAAQLGIELLPRWSAAARPPPATGHGRRADLLVPAAAGRSRARSAVRARLAEEITGYEPAWGEDWVSARPPTSAEAREFGIKRGSPVVVVHSRRFDADDTVLEYSELIARADTRIVYRYSSTWPPLVVNCGLFTRLNGDSGVFDDACGSQGKPYIFQHTTPMHGGRVLRRWAAVHLHRNFQPGHQISASG